MTSAGGLNRSYDVNVKFYSWVSTASSRMRRMLCPNLNKKLSSRKQIARQLRTHYVDGICSNFMTLKSGLGVTQGH